MPDDYRQNVMQSLLVNCRKRSMLQCCRHKEGLQDYRGRSRSQALEGNGDLVGFPPSSNPYFGLVGIRLQGHIGEWGRTILSHPEIRVRMNLAQQVADLLLNPLLIQLWIRLRWLQSGYDVK